MLFTYMMFIFRPLVGVNITGFTVCKELFLPLTFLPFQFTQTFLLRIPNSYKNNIAQLDALKLRAELETLSVFHLRIKYYVKYQVNVTM